LTSSDSTSKLRSRSNEAGIGPCMAAGHIGRGLTSWKGAFGKRRLCDG
jgi:hypothetical protein